MYKKRYREGKKFYRSPRESRMMRKNYYILNKNNKFLCVKLKCVFFLNLNN